MDFKRRSVHKESVLFTLLYLIIFFKNIHHEVALLILSDPIIQVPVYLTE